MRSTHSPKDIRLICLLLALATLVAAADKQRTAAPTGPVVHVTNGALAGKLDGDIAVFQGIPFARPPVGALRWREPQPVSNWIGTRDATKPGHPCMQIVEGTDNFIAPLAAAYGAEFTRQPVDPSEDCLYLNVWTPRLSSDARLPVMVWLHGGSNRVGSGAEPAYDGRVLASHGVVIVTVNYRLGVMGFFAHPELAAESPNHSSGNYGLLDQIAALRWVQQNIAQFGGDPANVTLFGESAGSIDATILMTSPLTSGLFRRVIAESGTAFGLGPSRTLAQMEPLGVAVGKEAGGQTGSQLEVLRKLPPAEIAQIEGRLIATQFKGYDPNASIVDGWVLPLSPAAAFASGRIQPVDLLVGLNAREFSAFRVGAAAAAKNLPQPPPGACPVSAEAALTTSAGRRAYVYRFDRSVPGKGEAELGAFHALEIPYVFGTFQTRGFRWLPFNATDYKLGQAMQSYWTNFAKSGDPNGPGLPRWDAWNTEHEPYLSFSQSGDAVPKQNFSPTFCHLSPERLKGQLGN